MGRSGRDRGWPPDPEPLPHPLVDDHTHLDHPAPGAGGFDGGPTPPTLAEQVQRAARAGVTRMVQVGCDLPAARWTADVVAVRDGAPVHPALLGAVALHPNEAPLHAGVREVGPDGLEPAVQEHHAVPLDDALAEVADLARTTERLRAVGETGLDFFRTGDRGRQVQLESFRAHVALAKELGLALQIHDRDAHDAVLDVLERDGAPERTVFHCFSGDAAMAARCAAQGWYLSFAGTVTFGAADELRAALRAVPLSQLLLETDAPYLTPHPYRGRPNAPYTVAVTARAAAATLDVDLATLCRTVWTTAEQVYGPW